MKTLLYLTLLLSISVLNSCSKKEDAATTDSTKAAATAATPSTTSATAPVTAGKYKIKSGIVTSTMEMPSMKQKMTEVLYFDDYGARESKETTGEMMGIKMHNLTFTKDGYIYHVDLEQKKATRTKGGAISADMDYSHLSDKMAAEYNVKKEGTEDVAGKTCEVYSMSSGTMKGRVSSWNGIPMHMDGEFGGIQMQSTVTKLEENASIPGDKFEVPADITIKDM